MKERQPRLAFFDQEEREVSVHTSLILTTLAGPAVALGHRIKPELASV